MVRWIILLLALASPAASQEGPVRVIDGDTFDVGEVRVRLFGVDAPERDQTCLDGAGSRWECGAWATAEVARLYAGRRAACEAVEIDRYGRTVARCEVEGADLGAALVAAGLATAYRRYSMDYDAGEKAAQVAGLGIWRGEIEAPAAHRQASRSQGSAGTDGAPDPGAPEGCAIKGNVSGNGRIYHLPGQAHYEVTRIDEAGGERWFCSEAEARAAGWRQARR